MPLGITSGRSPVRVSVLLVHIVRGNRRSYGWQAIGTLCSDDGSRWSLFWATRGRDDQRKGDWVFRFTSRTHMFCLGLGLP